MTQSWDKYFFDVTNVIASNSKCLSRKIGAIIVRDKSIISTGYNGAPRGVSSCSDRYHNDERLKEAIVMRLGINTKFPNTCPRQVLGYKSGEGLEWCTASHAERNTIVDAARRGVKVEGCTMYMSCPVPCSPCLIEIINAGIVEIVVTSLELYDPMSEYLLKESKLAVRQYNFK